MGGSWKKCSACKRDIGLKSKYYICSVSTCTGQRTGYQFCSVDCWEVHVPGARHRDAGALERISPATAEAEVSVTTPTRSAGKEVLIVASKLKAYIKARSDMSTSASVMDVLSEIVRIRCDDAIDNARREGRKTVLDRDFRR